MRSLRRVGSTRFESKKKQYSINNNMKFDKLVEAYMQVVNEESGARIYDVKRKGLVSGSGQIISWRRI